MTVIAVGAHLANVTGGRTSKGRTDGLGVALDRRIV